MATEVTRRLLDHLVVGGVHPGQRLPGERQLAEDLGVNRATVREALKTLSFLGVLDVHQSRGSYLRGPDSDVLAAVFHATSAVTGHRLVDIVETRWHLEVLIAQLAAQRRSDEDLLHLRAALQRMEATRHDTAAFEEADVAFHSALARSTGNPILNSILVGVRSVMFAWIARYIPASTSPTRAYADHLPVLAAVEAGDSPAAAQAMGTHMVRAAKKIATNAIGDDAMAVRELIERMNNAAATSAVADDVG
ncbi:FadR/GntR family transcriptional regulator [Kineococcus arenarius]|uniref:FadR/GntR family transcriptional regulator n=1 Tax=Kineococcus sp. SYSU DK007 TaxID=3383128 RepID=UPI003D7F108F